MPGERDVAPPPLRRVQGHYPQGRFGFFLISAQFAPVLKLPQVRAHPTVPIPFPVWPSPCPNLYLKFHDHENLTMRAWGGEMPRAHFFFLSLQILRGCWSLDDFDDILALKREICVPRGPSRAQRRVTHAGSGNSRRGVVQGRAGTHQSEVGHTRVSDSATSSVGGQTQMPQ
jgi:hypothetical protein